MKAFILVGLLCIGVTGFSQTKAYQSLVGEARSAYVQHFYRSAARNFSKAFKANDWKALPRDRFTAACAWAMDNNLDSAFYQLNYLVQVDKYTLYDNLANTEAFTVLQSDSRWNDILRLASDNKRDAAAKINTPLKKTLDSIYDRKLTIMRQISGVWARQGTQKPFPEELGRSYNEQGVEVRKAVTAILDQYGWPKLEEVGSKAISALGIVISDADSITQLTYLPIMRDAFEKADCPGIFVAVILDAISLRHTNKQIYGTRVMADPNDYTKFLVAELEDPLHVNEKRATLHLRPLEESMTSMYGTWTMGVYQRQLSWARKVSALQKMTMRAEGSDGL